MNMEWLCWPMVIVTRLTPYIWLPLTSYDCVGLTSFKNYKRIVLTHFLVLDPKHNTFYTQRLQKVLASIQHNHVSFSPHFNAHDTRGQVTNVPTAVCAFHSIAKRP